MSDHLSITKEDLEGLPASVISELTKRELAKIIIEMRGQIKALKLENKRLEAASHGLSYDAIQPYVSPSTMGSGVGVKCRHGIIGCKNGSECTSDHK